MSTSIAGLQFKSIQNRYIQNLEKERRQMCKATRQGLGSITGTANKTIA